MTKLTIFVEDFTIIIPAMLDFNWARRDEKNEGYGS
jgi:hypothetical protein